MADQQDDDFDESLLNQPWDPVSYFDEEEGTQPDNEQFLSGSSPNNHLTELFEVNLRSVEKDIKRMALRKQETVENSDSVFSETLEKDDTEEFCDTIDRFITYEDKEDHLKAVDNTVLINQKNIDSDIKRLAHFKQNSVQQDDEYLADLEGGSKGHSSIDDLVCLLPDAVQSEPVSVTSGPEVDSDNGIGAIQLPSNEELDLDLILPDAVTEEPNESKEKHPNDRLQKHAFNAENKSDKFIDFGLLDELGKRESTVKSSGYGLSDFSTMDSASGSSKGSADSLNKVIQAAEEIVLDFTKNDNNCRESNIDQQGQQASYNLLELEREFIEDKPSSSAAVKGDPDIIQITEKTFAPVDLLEGFDVGCSETERLNTSVSSLHDELLGTSPSFDLHEPNFGGPMDTSAELSDVANHSIRAASTSGESQVVKRKTNSDNGKKKRNVKKSKQKYLVEVLKKEDEESSDTGSESDVLIEAQLKKSAQGTKQTNYKPIAASSKAKEGEGSTQERQKADSIGLKTEEVVVQESPETMPMTLSTEQINQTTLNNVRTDDAEIDVSVLKQNELSEEARKISEQFADEILSEDVNNLADVQQNIAPEDDKVFQEGGVIVDSTPAVSTDRNVDDSQPEVEGAVAARSGTRSGSTSDSEELEDYINQQLRENPATVSNHAGAEGASRLPPISEEIQLGWYAPKWVPDKDAKACMNCGLKFTVVKRRHHCRACGKVLCSNCCNMKADLAYLGYKPSRVCQACYEVLSKAQSLSPLPLMSLNQDVPGRGHTISLNESEPGMSLDSPPQYMPDSPPEYSVLPGSAVQSGPPNPPSYFASSGRGSGFRSRTESDRSVVIMFNSSQTDLPPVLRIENEVVKIINNPNLKSLFHETKDKNAEPVAFLVNKNLVVKLKVISLDCCIGKECWCFSSDGMGASNQEEIVFLVEYKGDDQRLLKCVFQQFNLIFERAKHGEPLSDFGYVAVDEYMQNNRKNVGIILFKPNVQCVKNIMVPCHPHLFGLWIQETEVPWAKNLPLRLLVRLGAEFKSYPYPLFNLAEREPVFHVVGRTIIGLLADFRSFQYTLPRISGLLVSITKKDTTIKFPQTRYDEVLKVLNTSEENVMAFCGNFNRKADSHLVCVETDGTHTTQTISCRTSSKKLTGCSFIVFSAALKSSSTTLQAKTSIVEDGIMVQVTSDTMKKIRTALKEMQDLVTPAGDVIEGSTEVNKLKIVWGSSDDSASRTTSPIDGSPFDGLTNMRIRHSYDFTVSTSPAKIHWQEVYFLPNDADTVGRLSAKELSQMTSSVAKACMNALSPHLSTLVALQMTKIGLRMILDSDMVEYRIGSNKEQLPQELTGDLDDKLIPVIHSVMKTVSHRRVSAELIFQITRIV